MSAPSFSVVIAAYQSAVFVADAVRSALDQAPPPLEVIVADDGSTDDLAGALAPFGDAVRVERIEHGGEAAAKNAGAEVATGEFIAFLDADDRFLPRRLAEIGALASEHPELDVITTDAYLVHRGEVLGRCYGESHRFATTDQRSAILRGNFILGLSAVRRSRFLEVGGFDVGVAYTTDWELWMRLILSGSTVGFIPEPLAEYRLHDGSMSARRGEMARGRLESLARAAARQDLSPAERSVVAAAERRERARLAREELKETLLAGPTASARRAARRVALAPHQSPATRVKAVAAALLPHTARSRLLAEQRQLYVSVGDRRLER